MVMICTILHFLPLKSFLSGPVFLQNNINQYYTTHIINVGLFYQITEYVTASNKSQLQLKLKLYSIYNLMVA